MDLSKDAIWILGDSFCAEAVHPNRWTLNLLEYLQKKYTSRSITKYYNYANGGMDTQTILDNWIKLLPFMKENDAIVVCVSDISRTRYPLKSNNVYSLPFLPNPNNAPLIDCHFMYGNSDWSDVSTSLAIENTDVPFTNTEDYRDFNRAQNYILSTKSYDNSKIDIIEALYKITPCHKKFIYTWADFNILKSDYIYQKNWVSENVFNGKWESLHEQFIRTNGASGIEHDGHLSSECEMMMANYFIKEFEL
jgi:hypothetical protein